jgi:NitT/TauT family transport system substrate-binding protein
MCRTLIAANLIVAGLCATATAQELQRWRHGVIEPKGDGGFSLMVAHHGFATKYGLKLETLILKNGATAIKALLAGAVDSIEASPGAAILAGANGADIKIIGCNMPGLPHVVMARSHIATVQDLKGKTIAVAAPGSLPNLLMNTLLEKYTISTSEVRFANLGSDLNRFEAVVAGLADAAVVSSEFIAVAHSDVKVLAVARDLLPNYLRVCLMTSGKTLGTQRAQAIQFVAAQMDALQFTLNHRDATIKLTQEIIHTKPADPRAAYAYDDAVMHGAVDPLINLPIDKLQWMQAELVRAGNLKEPIDLSNLVDPEIRAMAVKRLRK